MIRKQQSRELQDRGSGPKCMSRYVGMYYVPPQKGNSIRNY